MKKLYELGAKTGLTSGEVNRVARFGVLGLLAFVLAALSGCFKAQNPPAAQEAKPQTLQDPVNSVNGSTAAAKSPDAANGPYPGYPTGTRYYTVSRADFRV